MTGQRFAAATLGLLLLVPAAAFAARSTPKNRPLVRARGSTNDVIFQDSLREDAAAPDITTVEVSNDDEKNIMFRIGILNTKEFSLTSDMAVFVGLDTDQNPATGSPIGGADYSIVYSIATRGIGRWNGSAFDFSIPAPSLRLAYAGGAYITINAADLGGVSAFNFVVSAYSGLTRDASGQFVFSNAHGDTAPDPGSGSWSFQLKTSPPPPQTPPPPPAVARLTVLPVGLPHAGKPFDVAVSLGSDNTTRPPDALSCAATLGAASLKTRIVPGGTTKTCRIVLIPVTAKGKGLTLVLQARSGSQNLPPRTLRMIVRGSNHKASSSSVRAGYYLGSTSQGSEKIRFQATAGASPAIENFVAYVSVNCPGLGTTEDGFPFPTMHVDQFGNFSGSLSNTVREGGNYAAEVQGLISSRGFATGTISATQAFTGQDGTRYSCSSGTVTWKANWSSS